MQYRISIDENTINLDVKDIEVLKSYIAQDIRLFQTHITITDIEVPSLYVSYIKAGQETVAFGGEIPSDGNRAVFVEHFKTIIPLYQYLRSVSGYSVVEATSVREYTDGTGTAIYKVKDERVGQYIKGNIGLCTYTWLRPKNWFSPTVCTVINYLGGIKIQTYKCVGEKTLKQVVKVLESYAGVKV